MILMLHPELLTVPVSKARSGTAQAHSTRLDSSLDIQLISSRGKISMHAQAPVCPSRHLSVDDRTVFFWE